MKRLENFKYHRLRAIKDYPNFWRVGQTAVFTQEEIKKDHAILGGLGFKISKYFELKPIKR